MDPHLLRDDDVGGGNRLRGVALLHRHRAEDVLLPLFVKQRGIRLKRRTGVGHDRQRLVDDLDQRRGVFGHVATLREDHGHGVADVPDLLTRENRIGLLLLTGDHREDLDLFDAPRIQVGGREDRLDARQLRRRRYIDRLDPGVGLRAAHKGELQSPGDA